MCKLSLCELAVTRMQKRIIQRPKIFHCNGTRALHTARVNVDSVRRNVEQKKSIAKLQHEEIDVEQKKSIAKHRIAASSFLRNSFFRAKKFTRSSSAQ